MKFEKNPMKSEIFSGEMYKKLWPSQKISVEMWTFSFFIVAKCWTTKRSLISSVLGSAGVFSSEGGDALRKDLVKLLIVKN